ncbi:uncharacterized protein [Mytilus edulis]|uniref:uncharacterized protein n=1 Tax=Mytilus edulis TaxID=6550 RepID=UPI0039EE60B0
MGLSLWNGKDSVVKERFFGLTGPQGNHGEDVKELYFYLDNDPDHRYMKALYLYPQTEFPYTELIEQNKGRSPRQSEYEILDTGVFDDGHWQIMVEYTKPENDTILCRYTVNNISNEVQRLNLSPKFWFRYEYDAKQMSNAPCFQVKGDEQAVSVSYQLGEFCLNFSKSSSGQSPEIELKRNHSNTKPDCCYAAYKLEVEPGGHDIIEWELLPIEKDSYLDNSSNVIQEWKIKAETFYNSLFDCQWSDQEKSVAKGAWAGLLWNKQFYYYDVDEWYNRGQATVKPGNWDVMERNIKWRKHFKAKDILSVPDKWEFPWFATWDTCFEMISFCRLDPDFAKHQLLLLLSERYMSPEGQLPGCEFNFDDNNPPIHAWTSLKVFQMTGGTDLNFLFNSYCKLQKNYNWWMTNLQCHDRYIFHGGFLGLDNISVVDRGCPPEGYTIKQADATTWMALFAISMIQIGLELTRHNFPTPGDIQKDLVKYLNDFLCISKQFNKDIYNGGMWNPEMTFYNDVLVDQLTEQYIPIQVKSLVGLLPLVACGTVNLSGIRCTEELKQVLQTDSIHVCGLIIVRSLVGLLPLVACGTVNLSGIRCTEELKQVLQTDSIHVCGLIIVRSLVGLLPLVACGTVNLSGIRCTEELKQVLQTDSIHVCGVIIVRSLVGLLPLVACGTVNFSGIRCTEELKQVLQTDSIHVCGLIIVRSLVGLLPLVACVTVNFSGIRCTEELKQVLQTDSIHIIKKSEDNTYFLTCVPPERITNLLERLFDEEEFLSNFGIRSLSKIHRKDYILTLPVRKKTTENPETFSLTENFTLHYAPGEADSEMMGGNSNWRGPIWICANYILLDAIEKIRSGLGSRLTIQYPAHKSKISLDLAVKDVCKRLVSMFLPDSSGARPLHGKYKQFTEEAWKDLILYYEYFHADSGRGCGASHQTGWTALITEILYKLYS